MLILHVLVFGGLLGLFELVRHRLCGVEVPDIGLYYVLLTLACERCRSALALLIDLVQVDHWLV